jgi:nucleoid-associated protein YgaU
MTSPTPAKKLSHEARLGIMVVTVLVFAFGFLVYHKVDMRQRALTQASIAGPGPAAASAAGEATAADAGNEQSVVSDPLQNSVPVASESPFADAADDTPQFAGNLSEPTGFADVSPVENSIVAADGFSEPALTGGPLANTDSSFAADTAMETTDTEEPLVAAAEPATGEPALEFPAPAAEPTERISNADSTAAQQPAVAESPEAVLPAIGSDTEFSAPVAAAADDSAAATFSAEPELTAEPAVTEQPVTEQPVAESTASDAAAPQFGAAESPEPAAPAATEEPVLLALAEPQDPPAFPGFTPDEPVQRAPAAEPVFGDSTDRVAEPAAPGRAASGYSTSAGFNAVARPAARPSRQALRNAAGSGTDGRFDLAAFNYQNSPQANPSSDAADVPTVVVQEGENYTKLSKRVYGTTRYFSALAVFNQHRIPDPRRMRPGMIVLTPDRRLLEEKYPQLFIDSQPRIVEPPGFLLLEDGSPAYRVGDRETLSDVSKKHLGRASRWIELYEMNRSVVNDPNKLKPGTILALPDDATEVVIMP